MKPKVISVPGELWSDRRLGEGARLLWCYLRGAGSKHRVFTYKEVREATGLCQNSLLRHLGVLDEQGWLKYEKTGRRSFRCKAVWKSGVTGLELPMDLILDPATAVPAKWVWGAIKNTGGPLTYEELIQLTGYSHNSLMKYIGDLQAKGWLQGSVIRSGRRKQFNLIAVNSHDIKRKAEVSTFYRCKRLAKQQADYSVGQLLMAYMVEQLVQPVTLIENGQLRGLINPRTGGRLHYDLFIAAIGVALEFQGSQHDGPTERFPSLEEYEALRERDELKRTLSAERQIRLIEVRAEDLTFGRLAELLRAAGVPLNPNPKTKWHLYTLLERAAGEYREEVAYRRSLRPTTPAA